MAGLDKGNVIGVPCQVKPGPFTGEHLISIDTSDGIINGFVHENELKQVSGKWYVRAVIEDVYVDRLRVWLRGSFFTTNGIATIPREMAVAA